jgi:Telomere resolvase
MRPKMYVMEQRHAAFIAKAKLTTTNEQARLLCEEELEWIYTTYNGTAPHSKINEFRKALRLAGLEVPYVYRYVDLVEDGVVISKEPRRITGHFCERQSAHDARFTHDKERLKKQNTLNTNRELLLGREDAYLTLAVQLLQAPDWEDAAVGLCMATGRRNVETGRQATLVPVVGETHRVTYTGQAKKKLTKQRDEQRSLPVLVRATLVCETLARVQAAIRAETVPSDDFDAMIGNKFRRAVKKHLRPLFPEVQELGPRTLRNFYVALCFEGVDSQGNPLLSPKEDPDTFLKQLLGHEARTLPHDHYKKFIAARISRQIPLP